MSISTAEEFYGHVEAAESRDGIHLDVFRHAILPLRTIVFFIGVLRSADAQLPVGVTAPSEDLRVVWVLSSLNIENPLAKNDSLVDFFGLLLQKGHCRVTGSHSS